MHNRPPMVSRLAAYLLGIVIALESGRAWATDAVPPVTLPITASEQAIEVNISGRKFEPPLVTLQAGRKTALIFQNKDAELHAFVAPDLFKGVNLNVSGNGAPEFGPEGFKRVIIPSLGRAEIRFVPEHPGRYSYFCDMPGHEMKAAIVVQ
jgi:plastocyanin